MAVELLELSNFKLQLLALISEIGHLRERERGAVEELQCSIQRQKQMEAEHAEKLLKLQHNVSLQEESQRMLETKVKYLENENELLERKEKEAKETINSLLQSRDAFLQHYEDSTWLLNQTIQKRDKKITVLSDKIQSHILLLDSIQKQVAAVKQVVYGVDDLVNEKEQLVTGLKRKIDRVPTLEKDFVEKILYLEEKQNHHQLELRRRDAAVFEIKRQLEVEKANISFGPEIEELKKALMVKDEIIQRLTSEKQALHLELRTMEVVVQKMQSLFSSISAEDQKSLSSVIESREISDMRTKNENGNLENVIQEKEQDSPRKNP